MIYTSISLAPLMTFDLAAVDETTISKCGRTLRLWVLEAHYNLLTLYRNKVSTGLTLILPLTSLVVFGIIFGNKPNEFFSGRGAIDYYTPITCTTCLFGSAFTSLSGRVASDRLRGTLKRLRATPLPASAYIAGAALSTIVGAVIDILLCIVIGVSFGSNLPHHPLQLVAVVALGSLTLIAVSFALSSALTNPASLEPLSGFIIFPLLLLSGSFVPIHNSGLRAVSRVFPVNPINQALLAAFQGGHIPTWVFLNLVSWTVIGLIVSTRYFRWNS